ncbi:MAG: TolC family protein [Saprospiraceae bacterium]|nr:TolC family protein [Lewinella sp.]
MKLRILIIVVLLPGLLPAQSLSLDACYELARSNYPLLRQQSINEQITALQLEKLDLQKLPQISWNAQATYQSESIEVPLNLPNGERLAQPKLNGQTTLEANYNIYDGGRIDAAKTMEQARLNVSQQSLEVELDKLKKQVNQLYFGIILSRAQDSILLQTRADLEVRLDQLQAGEREGVVLPSEVNKLKVELLRLESQRDNLAAQVNRLASTLGGLIGRAIEPSVALELPANPGIPSPVAVGRPELELFQQQKQEAVSQLSMIEAQRKPQLGAFVRAGVGYANPFNFFDTNLSPFAMAGIQFHWNILDWGKKDKDRQLVQLRTEMIDTQKATFLHNLDLLDGQYIADENKLQQLIEQSEAIRLLQEELLQQTAAQLEHGVATANDYLIQSNAITQTRLNLKLYQLQLLQLKIDYLTDKGLL